MSDTNGTDMGDSPRSANYGDGEFLVGEPSSRLLARNNAFLQRLPGAVRSPILWLNNFTGRIAEKLSETDKRRRRSALALAIFLNLFVLSALAIFGRFEIWRPLGSSNAVSAILIDLPVDPLVPELREPEIAEEPELEDEPEELPEPEVIEEFDNEQEPEPVPMETDEPASGLILPDDPEFREPATEPAPPQTFDNDRGGDRGGPLELDDAQGQENSPNDGEQVPRDAAQPLIAEEREIDGEINQDDLISETEEDLLGLSVNGERPDVPAPVEGFDREEVQVNDDIFDQEPVFDDGRVTLPKVDLPDGEQAATPGTSGIVAIYCPEQFDNKDKQAECAGRTEIRSGWRPGSSGEDWSKAVQLLRQARKSGRARVDPALLFGREVARRMEDEIRARDLEDFRRSADELNEPFQEDNLTGEFGRPAEIGPEPFEPSWTRREDPIFDQDDLERLRKALDEAESEQPE